MTDRARALQLVEKIYQAAVEPARWDEFLTSLSDDLHGAAIQFSLRLPDEAPSPDAYHSTGLDPTYMPVFIKLALDGLPWGSLDNEVFRGRFGSADELLTDQRIQETDLYLDFMRPQGLAAEWPICHLIAVQDGRPMSGVVVYHREGHPRIGPPEMELLDALVPHLARAYEIHSKLRAAQQESDALRRAVDRLPTGVLVLDEAGRVTMANRSAEDVLDAGDGLELRRGSPSITDERRNRALQEAIQASLRDDPRTEAGRTRVMIVPRPSGRRAYSVLVSPLLPPEATGSADEARAIIFVADPEIGQIGTTEVLESLYQLTHAEADLVRLIAEGHSLEQVADTRGVTMNTVRSQLKQVFSKTDTNRQGELVHLVLAGVARIRGLAGECASKVGSG